MAFLWAAFLAVVTGAAACSHTQQPAPCTDDEVVRVVVSASPETNSGHGVLVRVFLLKSDLAFTAADFDDLIRGEVPAMKEDSVAAKEAVIIPGQRETTFEFPRGNDNAVRSLGVFAALEPREGTWRLTRKLSPPNPTGFCHIAGATDPIKVRVEGQQMSLATKGPKT